MGNKFLFYSIFREQNPVINWPLTFGKIDIEQKAEKKNNLLELFTFSCLCNKEKQQKKR